jgi:hypothetical protein
VSPLRRPANAEPMIATTAALLVLASSLALMLVLME